MKVVKIERDENFDFLVTIKPSWIARLFGAKERTERYRDNGSYYAFGGQTVYIDRNGEKLGNWSTIGTAIDNWRRSF